MPQTDEKQEWYTAREVAGKLNLHYLTVLRLLKTKKLQGARAGGSWRVKKSYLDNLDTAALIQETK